MSASMIREVIATQATLDSIYTNVIDIKPGGSSLAIHNLIDPTADQDAATKHYVDTSITASTGANKALSNLASVAINTSLLPASAGSADLGTALLPFGNVYSNSLYSASGDLSITQVSSLLNYDLIATTSNPLTISVGSGNLILTSATGLVQIQNILDLQGNNLQNVAQIVDVNSHEAMDITNRSLIYTDGSTIMFSWSTAGVLSANSNKLSNLAPGVAGTDAVNMNQLQNAMTGTQWRPEVALFDSVHTTLPSSTSTQIDSVTVTNGMRVLFVNLASANNEVYVATVSGTSISWAAALDNGRLSAAPVAGDSILVLSGTVYALSSWNYSGSAWVQFNGATQIQPGTAMSKSGNTLNVLFDNSTIGINGSNQLYVLANSIGVSKLGTITDGVTLDQSGAGSTLEVKAGGISNAQVNSAAAIAYSKLAALGGSTGAVLTQSSSGYVQASGIASSNLFLADGSVTATGAFNLGGFQINNMADPSVSTDAATKGYVDSAIVAGAYLPLAGGTMAGNINMGNYSLSNVNDMSAVTVEASSLMTANGGLSITSGTFSVLMGVTVDFGNNTLTDLADPSNPQDAVTLSYMQTYTSSAYLSLSGGSMTGSIDMGAQSIVNMADPSNPQDAATKNYVDSSISSSISGLSSVYLALTGGTMSGVLNMGGQYIQNLATPSLTTDAATKGYVDSAISSVVQVDGDAIQLLGGVITLVLDGSTLSASGSGLKVATGGITDNEINSSAAIAYSKLASLSSTAGNLLVAGVGGNYVSASSIASSNLFLADGSVTATGAFNLGSFKISNLATPSVSSDAATKGYVDSAISTAGGSYLLKAGGTMSGAINMGGNQINDLAAPSLSGDAVNLGSMTSAISAAVANYLPLAGGTMSGVINMGSNKISALADPTLAQDAVTLNYLDNALSLSPAWQKFTVAYSALSASGSTNTITLFSLGAKQVIHGVVVKHSVAFSGGTLSGYTVSVGVASEVARYSSAFDVFQAVGTSTAQASDDLSPEDFSSATNITITAVASGDTLNDVTAGSVDVWVAISTLN